MSYKLWVQGSRVQGSKFRCLLPRVGEAGWGLILNFLVEREFHDFGFQDFIPDFDVDFATGF